MKSLIWKEVRENLKWVPLPGVLIVGLMGVLGLPFLMEDSFLTIFSLIAAVFATGLGFVQFYFESRGDRRSLLLHRPMARSRIFWAKATAGALMYLVALGTPWACVVAWAATPGHVSQPFRWGMAWPWLADVLTGLVYYFAGILAAQREARWYGSRALGAAAGLFTSLLVWTLPEFWQALLAAGLLAGLVAVAAWGSFLTGGAYAPQPPVARAALAGTFLAGLCALSFLGKVFLGAWVNPLTDYWYAIDRNGGVLLVHQESGRIEGVTDVRGRVPPALEGSRLEKVDFERVVAPPARGIVPRTRSYRNPSRFLVKFSNETRPADEDWWYVPDVGRLFGYERRSKRPVGSFGPDGFARPREPAAGRFHGVPAHVSRAYFCLAAPYLALPGGVYAVNFRTQQVRPLFVAAAGETVRWASRWDDGRAGSSVLGSQGPLAFVGTDRAIHAITEQGDRRFSARLAYDPRTYGVTRLGRLEDPERFWAWYEPAWYLPLDRLESLPAGRVLYDRAGHEVDRQEVPPRPGGARALNISPPVPIVEPSPALAWFGPATSPAEAAGLFGLMRHLESEARGKDGTEVDLLLQFLYGTTQFFLPGVRHDLRARPALALQYGSLVLLSAGLSALACLLIARRYSFSPGRRIAWSLCGLVLGPTGLLLMLALQEWPARVGCPACRKSRLVTLERCEHCGAAHAAPAPDGTEILEPLGAAPPALAGR